MLNFPFLVSYLYVTFSHQISQLNEQQSCLKIPSSQRSPQSCTLFVTLHNKSLIKSLLQQEVGKAKMLIYKLDKILNT